jgi:shikimate dehydrogenase
MLRVYMKKCAVIGFPVEHSLSSVMHNAGYKKLGLDFVYEKISVEPKDLSCFMKRVKTGEFVGLSVTVPHKESVLDFADQLTPAAEAIGAANTLYFEGSKLVADNTDYIGFWDSLREHIDSNVSYLVCGAGGASRAILYALQMNGVKDVYILNRTLGKAQLLAEEFGFKVYNHELVDVLVNTTSSRSFVPEVNNVKFIFDINYGETDLLRFAEKNNIPFCNGKKMLLYQGAKQFEIFTQNVAPVEVMYEAINN